MTRVVIRHEGGELEVESVPARDGVRLVLSFGDESSKVTLRVELGAEQVAALVLELTDALDELKTSRGAP